MEGPLTLLLSDILNRSVSGETSKERSPEADKLREEIRQSLSEKRQAPDAGTTPPETKA